MQFTWAAATPTTRSGRAREAGWRQTLRHAPLL